MTDFEKLYKIGGELTRARAKREEIDAQIKELERKYREAENVTIHNLVHGANMSPEQLAALIKMSAGEKLEAMKDDSEDVDENEDDESEDIKDDEETY